MNKKDIEELRKLINAVIYSPTKNDSKYHVKKLNFKKSQMGNQLDSYLKGVLKKIVNHAKEASGNVKDKERWISDVNENLSFLESEIKDDQ